MRIILILLCVMLVQGENSSSESKRGANTQPQSTQTESAAVPTPEATKAGIGSSNNQGNSAQWSDPLVVLQLLLFLAVVVQAGVYVWQAILMRRTLRILRRQADTLEEAGETEQSQLKAMQDQIEVMKDSLKHSERALLAGESQADAAKQSVQIAKETFYIGERPYFGITNIEMSIISNRPRVVIEFENGGKTPAWQFYALVWVTLGDDPSQESSLRWNLNSQEPPYSHRYFGVGQRHEFVFYSLNVLFTAEQVHDINLEQVRVFVHGTAHYKDMRGDPLYHNFTSLWHGHTKRFSDWEA